MAVVAEGLQDDKVDVEEVDAEEAKKDEPRIADGDIKLTIILNKNELNFLF